MMKASLVVLILLAIGVGLGVLGLEATMLFVGVDGP